MREPEGCERCQSHYIAAHIVPHSSLCHFNAFSVSRSAYSIEPMHAGVQKCSIEQLYSIPSP